MTVVPSDEGLRQGSPGVFTVYFRDGYAPKNLSLYSVTARASFEGQVDFPVVTGPVEDADNSAYQLRFAGSDLDSYGPLRVEFFFDGPEVTNVNAAVLVIPVRPVYGDAP